MTCIYSTLEAEWVETYAASIYDLNAEAERELMNIDLSGYGYGDDEGDGDGDELLTGVLA